MIAAAAQQLPGVLHALEPTLSRYGYLAVAGFVLVEDFGVPVPGETILILGAVYAGTGRLNIFAGAAIGILAAAVGDNIRLRARTPWRAAADRALRPLCPAHAGADHATAFFTRHGGRIIVVARFIPGLRQANGIVAGISRMRWKHFAVFNVVGATLWVIAWTTLGYLSGSHIEAIYADATRYSTYIAVAFAALGLGYVTREWRRRRRTRVAATSAAAACLPRAVDEPPQPVVDPGTAAPSEDDGSPTRRAARSYFGDDEMRQHLAALSPARRSPTRAATSGPHGRDGSLRTRL